jgi:Semialdehyde dehydrogenase, NAD binding domain/Aspartate/ornithine carbamoyltransferase, Asp/Orn binding domain
VKKTPKAAVANPSDIKVAVIGASGYVGEELVRLLLRHPHAELVAVTSRQFAGKRLADVFPRLSHHQKAGDLRFGSSDPVQLAQMAQIIFLALPHGFAAEFAKPLVQTGARIVDLSADFRIKDAKIYQLYTDIWVSMGREGEEARRQAELGPYWINGSLVKLAKPNALVMHCLPAHRGQEIDEKTFEAHAQTIFDEAENRLHVQKAILAELVKGD